MKYSLLSLSLICSLLFFNSCKKEISTVDQTATPDQSSTTAKRALSQSDRARTFLTWVSGRTYHVQIDADTHDDVIWQLNQVGHGGTDLYNQSAHQEFDQQFANGTYSFSWASQNQSDLANGTEFKIADEPKSAMPGYKPIYRYNQPYLGWHFYSSNWYELNAGINNYTYEGIEGYSYPDASYPNAVPVYRFNNHSIGDYLYSTSQNVDPAYTLEGVAFYLSSVFSPSTSIPLTQWFDPSTGRHLYLRPDDEDPQNMPGWQKQGTVAYLYTGANVLPFYRYSNNGDGTHLYTTTTTEVGAPGWKLDGNMGYIDVSQSSNSVPLYRYYNSSNGDHFYTIAQQSYPGYVYEKTPGYVWATQVTGTVPVYSYYNSRVGHFLTTTYSELGGGSSVWTYEGVKFYIKPKF